MVFYHLARDTELQRRLRADAALLAAAVEELLRAYPIVPPARTLTRDHELGSVLRVASTTAFGLGPHRCLGSHLAKQELVIVLELMIEMMPEFEVSQGFEPKWHTLGKVWGIDALPFRFTR